MKYCSILKNIAKIFIYASLNESAFETVEKLSYNKLLKAKNISRQIKIKM